MAIFLILAGLTGTFITFYDELETLAHPEFMLAKPMPNQAMINQSPLQNVFKKNIRIRCLIVLTCIKKWVDQFRSTRNHVLVLIKKP